ncbi:MAG: methyltransferase [Alistipes sp.]|nr:methyltransferase [Alistipes senegalensis]MCM1250103.1 methyltransferase [Alistipes sp.]
MSVFHFKRFAVRQDATPMKVGTDGVLLGAWVSVRPSDRRILDIGTGTGLIALMLAQRSPQAEVVGIDAEDVAEARANAAASPWAARIRMAQCPVQEFSEPEGFDLVVSNPPFFVDSLPCPDAGRTVARHAVRLPFSELRDAVVRLLAPGGRFAVILPADAAARFIALCCGPLVLTRRTDVRTTPRRPARRCLLEFVRSSAACVPAPECDCLTVGTGEHECYTPEYRALTRDFYLKF